MQDFSYSLLNAVGYAQAVGAKPRLARASTVEEVCRLARTAEGVNMAHRSRLFKAVDYLKRRGFSPNHALSTIREVVLEAADGQRALATSRGEAMIGNHLERRFLNG